MGISSYEGSSEEPFISDYALPEVSIVMPVFNEGAWAIRSCQRACEAANNAGVSIEIIVVDDGSHCDVGAAIQQVPLRCPVRTVRHEENEGRLVSRLTGLRAAQASVVMLLDARVELDTGALAFWKKRWTVGADDVWVADISIVPGSDVASRVWMLITRLAWRRYYRERGPVAFTYANFDEYPKGTTCLVAGRDAMLDAHRALYEQAPSPRSVNDDTALLRPMSVNHVFRIDPGFSARYHGRSGGLLAAIRHTWHRGAVLFSGHVASRSRFTPIIVAFLLVFPALVMLGLLYPGTVGPAWLLVSLVTLALALYVRMSISDAAIACLAIVPFGLVYSCGAYLGAVRQWRPSRRGLGTDNLRE